MALCFLFAAEGPRAGERVSPEAEGRALAAELCAQRPATNLTTTGVLRLRDSNGKWRQQIPVSFEVSLGADQWTSRYHALTTNGALLEILLVTHRLGQGNRYEHARAQAGVPPGPLATLDPSAANTPFAGSQFWLTDLGMEFLHWPAQRLVKREMRKGRSCRVLESTNPEPASGGYGRVLSWIDVETDGVVRAEAYDAQRRLVKEFSVGNFKRINKVWQLKSMEIRDEVTDCRTRLEFDLEVPE